MIIPDVFFLFHFIAGQKWQEKYVLKGDNWYRNIKVNDMPVFSEDFVVETEKVIAAYLWATNDSNVEIIS